MLIFLVIQSYCLVKLNNRVEQNGALFRIALYLGLHDIARLILILYCIDSIFKTLIDTIFLYNFRYNIKIVVTRMSRILSCLENNLKFSNRNNLLK